MSKATENTCRFVFQASIWGFTRVTSPGHQGTRTGWFWWKHSTLRGVYPRREYRLWRGNDTEIVQEHLYDLAEVWSTIRILFPTCSHNQSQILWEVFSTGPRILKQQKFLKDESLKAATNERRFNPKTGQYETLWLTMHIQLLDEPNYGDFSSKKKKKVTGLWYETSVSRQV